MSIKCMRCGLMNFAHSEGCRRCQTPFINMPPPPPVPQNNYPPAYNFPHAPAGGPYDNAYMPYQPTPGVYFDPARQYYGIGGWLLLPAIGLVLSPLVLIHAIVQGMGALSQLERIAGSGMNIPTGDMRTLVVVEVLGNALLLIFVFFVIVPFFKQRRIAPTLFMTFLLAYLVFAAVDHLVAESAVNGFLSALSARTGDIDVMKELNSNRLQGIQLISRTALSCAIWIPYFQKSKRVKATFIH